MAPADPACAAAFPDPAGDLAKVQEMMRRSIETGAPIRWRVLGFDLRGNRIAGGGWRSIDVAAP